MEKKDLEYELNVLSEKYNHFLDLLNGNQDQRSRDKIKLYLWDLGVEKDLLKRLIKTYFSEENNPEQGEDKK